jgi:3-deoxy-D-manno-octulosonic-acid transferase
MNPLEATYKAAALVLASAGFPGFWLYTRVSGRYRRGLEQRLGFVPAAVLPRLRGQPRIWVHAVSLGEVRVAFSLVRALEEQVPGCSVLISTTTDHGFDLALDNLGPDFPLVYAPVDVPFCVRRALLRVRPAAVVFLETELWPGWIAEARALGIPAALLNGRISPRSFEGYRRFRFFFKRVLSGIDAFSMISARDAQRIRELGAGPDRIRVNGNAKYDLLAEQVDGESEEVVRRILRADRGRPVFVAGSTRSGEERLVLEAFERIRNEFPETLLVIAPRHLERVREVAELVRARGLRCSLRSDLQEGGTGVTAPVVILDTFGELFRFYSAASFVFCGASLVPLGGQNPLEPAAWGKPVFYGPSMEDFEDATALLREQGADGAVVDAGMLAREAIRLLRAPGDMEERGERARRAVLSSRRAARLHAQVVAELLEGR